MQEERLICVTRFSLCDKNTGRYAHSIYEHIAGSLAKAYIESFSPMYTFDFHICKEMKNEVYEWKNKGENVILQYKNTPDETCGDSCHQVGTQSGVFTEAYYNGPFAGVTVVIAVTIVVYNQQTVNDKPAGN